MGESGFSLLSLSHPIRTNLEYRFASLMKKSGLGELDLDADPERDVWGSFLGGGEGQLRKPK